MIENGRYQRSAEANPLLSLTELAWRIESFLAEIPFGAVDLTCSQFSSVWSSLLVVGVGRISFTL